MAERIVEGDGRFFPTMPDLEEVIRCRDCEYFDTDECRCRQFLVPYPPGENGSILKGAKLMANVDPDGFCAWAEGREP